MIRYKFLFLLSACLLLVLVFSPRHPVTAESGNGFITLASVNSLGEQGDGASVLLSVSADGRYTLFHSCSNNLVVGMFPDLNCDVLRRDWLTGETLSLASRPYTNSQGQSGFIGQANTPQGGMSADGRIVVFVSGEEYVVPGDTNYELDIFIRDTETNEITRITRQDGTEFDRGAYKPKISADGSFILFASQSTNIDLGPRWNEDLYLYERATGEITRITTRQVSDGYDEPRNTVISDNGRFILFNSYDNNFVAGLPNDGLKRVYLFDRLTESYQVIGPGDNNFADPADITPDGRYILIGYEPEAILPDITANEQVFVYDTTTATFTLISKNENGQPMDSPGGGSAISDDGRYVVFHSEATNLVPGYSEWLTRLYLADRQDGSLQVISSGQSGEDANGGVGPYSESPYLVSMSPDGRYIGFTSYASNLTANDTNGASDAFVYESFTLSDSDGDGLSEAIEDGALNGGDGNNDGIADSQQPNVASLPNSVSGLYLTLAAPSGTQLLDVQVTGNPAPGTEPVVVDFPFGFLQFTLDGFSPATSVTLDLFVEGGGTTNTYYKYGPTADNLSAHWYEFPYDGATGAETLTDKIRLHFVDGGRGDADLVANGFITDPGAPAFLSQPPFDFSGFFAPVNNLPVINSVKAGSAVPIKFSLGDDYGMHILALGYPRSVRVQCDSGATVDAIEQTVSAGSSGLQYDQMTGVYTYVWKTSKSWSGTCRQFQLELTDGVLHQATFTFK